MNNVKIELDCPTCGKGVITLGLHCPDDLNMDDNTPDNCDYKEY